MRILAQSPAHRTRPRLFWIIAGAGAFTFGVVTAFGTVSQAPEPVLERAVVEPLAPRISVAADRQVYFREERFGRGDTFAALFERLGIDDAEARRLLASAPALSALRALRPGTTVQARTGAGDELLALWFIGARDTLHRIERGGDGFATSAAAAALSRLEAMKSGEIRHSLFGATDAAGVPDAVAVQLADMFAGDIDFHRDLRRGDTFSVVFEQIVHEGRTIGSGRVLAAEFVNQGKAYRAVWFQDADGRGGYFAPDGKSLRKAFLRSPLEFSRVTSAFGLRHHPILRQWRAHKGVDYGAPSGTRVRATAHGTVDFVGRQGGYGNMVLLRHGGATVTAYGHLSRFAAGLRRGARVAQGDVIGFVGQTGWATGPHLHYEFRVNDQQRNPLTIALPAAQPVAPGRMTAFRAVADPLAARLELLRSTNLALLE